METGGISPSPPLPSIPDWDKPFTDLELEAIEAAFTSASSSPTRKRHVTSSGDGEDRPKSLRRSRRLPDSMVCLRQSTALIGCRHRRDLEVNLKMRYPSMSFGGQIVYSRTVTEVEKAAMELLKFVEAKKREMDQVILGIDIEWRPTFRKGVSPGKAAVMQICGDTSHCYVMHIIHSGIPQNLRSLLEDPTSVKVGVGIGNDAVKVFKDHNVSIKALEELSSLANQKLGGDPKKWSLASLTEMLTCKQLQKPNRIKLGNWEADILSKQQLQYAATDAFASWFLHQALKSLPDPSDDKSEELRGLPPQDEVRN